MCHAEFAHIPVGKQRRHPQRHPSSIWYTSSSGIWQTVWLEPVSPSPTSSHLPCAPRFLQHLSIWIRSLKRVYWGCLLLRRAGMSYPADPLVSHPPPDALMQIAAKPLYVLAYFQASKPMP